MNVHHDEIGEELGRPLLPLHDGDEGRGDVLFGLDSDHGLELLAERRVVGLEVLEELLVHLDRQYVDRLEAALDPQRRRLLQRALVPDDGVPFFREVARRHVVHGDVHRAWL